MQHLYTGTEFKRDQKRQTQELESKWIAFKTQQSFIHPKEKDSTIQKAAEITMASVSFSKEHNPLVKLLQLEGKWVHEGPWVRIEPWKSDVGVCHPAQVVSFCHDDQTTVHWSAY